MLLDIRYDKVLLLGTLTPFLLLVSFWACALFSVRFYAQKANKVARVTAE